tara:strand:+ start:1021 stop:2031 length:1011 start_codon:yes stop_codon:yes gene_type:complete
MAIGKISALAIASVNKVSALAKASIAKVNEVVNQLFSNTKALTHGMTETTGDYSTTKGDSVVAGNRSNSGGADLPTSFNFTQDTAWSVSFWVRAGWNSSLNTNIHLMCINKENNAGTHDYFRIYYNESNNRIYAQYGDNDGTHEYKQNFWLFHSNTGNYAAAFAAAGLGSSFWSAANRGNVGDDNFTLITVTKGASNSAASSNLKLYWNATDCGIGFYASGQSSGTVAMDSGQIRQMIVGGNLNVGRKKMGNSSATLYNDFAWWDAELDADAVAAVYNSGTPMDLTSDSGNYDNSSDLIGYWQWEDTVGGGVGASTVPGSGVADMYINGDSDIVEF